MSNTTSLPIPLILTDGMPNRRSSMETERHRRTEEAVTVLYSYLPLAYANTFTTRCHLLTVFIRPSRDPLSHLGINNNNSAVQSSEP
jgi:hypothetical protein